MNSRQHGLFPGFAGVALADILANSVAIVILMIVVTLFVKHEQDQTKLEQVEDVSVLLSREIASSVVMNSLPTSAPARLHNYETSILDRNPHPSLMPILELHDNYVRNYYTGKKIGREELLLQNNSLDRYLSRLTQAQRVRVRIDIYSIRLYYIVMSIFKSHTGRMPYHWHFLAYPTAPGGKQDKQQQEKFEYLAYKEGTDDSEREENTDGSPQNNQAGDVGPGERNGLTQPGNQSAIPLQAEPFLETAAQGGNYPYNDLSFNAPDDFDRSAAPPQDLPGSEDATDALEQQSNSIFSALSRLVEENLSQQGQPSNRRGRNTVISRFRSANPGDVNASDSQLQLKEKMPATGSGEPGQTLSFLQILPALFEYMEEVQSNTDRGQNLSMLANYHFQRDILSRIGKTRSFSPEEIKFFVSIAETIHSIPDKKEDSVFTTLREDPETLGNALSVPINQRLEAAILLHDSNQTKPELLPGNVKIIGQFSLYPEIYKGISFPFPKGMLLLMPPRQTHKTEFRWRVVTLVSPALDDFVTAYVYAKIDQGRLIIASDENGLRLANLPIVNQFPKVPFRQERWQALFYTLVAGLILLGITRRYRRTA